MRMVLLLHELPDGSSHFDWMIERRGGGGLITFRVSARIDRLEHGSFEATRLPDHRREYLSFEGEVSGGRGRVRRLAEGEATDTTDSPERIQIAGGFERAGTWRGRVIADRWVFTFEPA